MFFLLLNPKHFVEHKFINIYILSPQQQGRKATISFLRHYVHENNPPRKEHAGGVPSSAQRNGVGVGRLGGSQLNPPITPKLNLPSSSEPPTPRTKRKLLSKIHNGVVIMVLFYFCAF